MSRAYLETLADLPWSALASHRATPQHADDVGAGTSAAVPAEPGDGTGASAGSTAETADEEDGTVAVTSSISSTAAGEADIESYAVCL